MEITTLISLLSLPEVADQIEDDKIRAIEIQVTQTKIILAVNVYEAGTGIPAIKTVSVRKEKIIG